MLNYRSDLKGLARNLRNSPTDAEQRLWQALRSRQLGVHFYLQKPLGRFIVDFYSPAAKLVVELDGSQHQTEPGKRADHARDTALAQMGLSVLRFDDRQVLLETKAVLERILEHVQVATEKSTAAEIPPGPPLSKGGTRHVGIAAGASCHAPPPFAKGGLGGISSPAKNTLPPAIFLMGPTASGKTASAVQLVEAGLPVELISVDSALVYREMDIGTAKPDAATLARAPHHLIDIIGPEEAYSTAQFRDDALRLMTEISARGKVPVLVGGSMLYFNTLQHGIHDLPQADAALRAQIDAEAAALGWPALHARLAVLDPVTAARLQPNDAQRIGRALEVCLLAGQPMSALLATPRAHELPFALHKIALLPSDRAVLHQRIAQRFDEMLAGGLLEEVRGLRARHVLQPDMPSMRCVGYRQAWEFLDGAIDAATLRDKGIAATRQLAKRQLTWLRGMDDLIAVDCLRADLPQAVQALVEGCLSA